MARLHRGVIVRCVHRVQGPGREDVRSGPFHERIRLAVDVARGQRAEKCFGKKGCRAKYYAKFGAFDETGRELSLEEGLRRGLVKCNEADGCVNPLPELDPYSAGVFWFFLDCKNLWKVGEHGQRLRIPRDELDIEARNRGIVLSEFFLDKFAECERVLIDIDAELLRQQVRDWELKRRGR